MAPCDFFFLGYVKSQIYENNPQIVPELKKEIQRVVNQIEGQVCIKVIADFTDRVIKCKTSRHICQILFSILKWQYMCLL